MNLKIAIVINATVLCFQMLNADPSDIKVTPAGFAYYQIGQLVKTSDPEGIITGLQDKAWDQHVKFRITLDAAVQHRLRIIAGTEFGFVTRKAGGGNSVTADVSLKETQGIYTFGDDLQKPRLQVAVGFFPFKYNPEATNMGEYLFSYRTGAYAPYIINDFDNCKSRLLGLRMTSVFLGSLKQDLLFTSEMKVGAGSGNMPWGDYSLSYLLGYKLKNIIDAGAGVCFNRLVPLDPSQTTIATDIVLDSSGSPIIENGDTLRLTTKAAKLMSRITFDPKSLLPQNVLSIFGKEDLKLYAETAILGVKNYNGYANGMPYYNDIKKRWPIMWGFNVPTLKLLDFISCEFEYFAWDYNLAVPQGTPLPNTEKDKFSDQQKFRWSVFMKKTVTAGFCIKGLMGKDHFRTVDAGGGVTKDEFLRGNGNWHYNVRFMYEF